MDRTRLAKALLDELAKHPAADSFLSAGCSQRYDEALRNLFAYDVNQLADVYLRLEDLIKHVLEGDYFPWPPKGQLIPEWKLKALEGYLAQDGLGATTLKDYLAKTPPSPR